MYTLRTIANTFMTAITLVTALGVFTHDTRVDKAAMTAFSGPSVRAVASTRSNATVAVRYTDFMSSDAHTHPDHNTGKSLLSSFFYQAPSIAPRRKSHRKELLHEVATAPRHAFDNVNLPILD